VLTLNECIKQLNRICAQIKALCTQASYSPALIIRSSFGVDFMGPWSVLSELVGFTRWSQQRLLAHAPPQTVLLSDDFCGITTFGLLHLVCTHGQCSALLNAPPDSASYISLARAFSAFARQPPGTKPSHAALNTLRTIAFNNETYFIEDELLALFDLPALDKPARVYQPFLTSLTAVAATTTSSTVPQPAKQTTASFRLLFDLNTGFPVDIGQKKSKNRVWVLSPAAALHLFFFLLSQPLFIHAKPNSIIADCLFLACNELFRCVASDAERRCAHRVWTSALIDCCSSALAELSKTDTLHADLHKPLLSLACALGHVSRTRNEQLAEQLATAGRSGHFGMHTLSVVSPEQYMERFTEPIARTFLYPTISSPIDRARGSSLPNLTTADRERARATAALTVMGEMMLRASHRAFTPPLSDAIGLDIYTVTCTCSFCFHFPFCVRVLRNRSTLIVL
jgi:hypothetical protein